MRSHSVWNAWNASLCRHIFSIKSHLTKNANKPAVAHQMTINDRLGCRNTQSHLTEINVRTGDNYISHKKLRFLNNKMPQIYRGAAETAGSANPFAQQIVRRQHGARRCRFYKSCTSSTHELLT